MFTGIVEATGEVATLRLHEHGAELFVHAKTLREGTVVGSSVSVNGCCLTVTRIEKEIFAFDLLDETLVRTNLGQLSPPARVNLERPLLADGRLGGHFVQGHIDCAADVLRIERVGNDHLLEIELPEEFAKYVAFKGSIAVNGVSLTVAEVRERSFVVWIIPHTMEVTNLPDLKPGSPVNLEFDLLAKYVERMLAAGAR